VFDKLVPFPEETRASSSAAVSGTVA